MRTFFIVHEHEYGNITCFVKSETNLIEYESEDVAELLGIDFGEDDFLTIVDVTESLIDIPVVQWPTD